MNCFNFDAEIRKLLVGISSIFPSGQNVETSPWYCFDLQQCITQLWQGVRARFNNLLRRSCSAVFCLSSYVCVYTRTPLSFPLSATRCPIQSNRQITRVNNNIYPENAILRPLLSSPEKNSDLFFCTQMEVHFLLHLDYFSQKGKLTP